MRKLYARKSHYHERTMDNYPTICENPEKAET